MKMDEPDSTLIERLIAYLIVIVIIVGILYGIYKARIYFKPIPVYKFEEDCTGWECQRSINKQLYDIKNLLKDRNEKDKGCNNGN